MLKGYSPGQLVFGRNMIILIKNKMDWELIRQQNQAQNNKDNIRENIKIDEHDCKVVDKAMLTNNTAYKYETPYDGQFVITQCWTNVAFTLKSGPIQTRHNISQINPYTYDTNI